MSPSDPSRRPSDSSPNDRRAVVDARRMIDRLVDDELSPSERRALIGQFERSPDLWRACALAFLESQAFAGDFKAIRRGNDGSRGEAEPAPRPFPVRIDPVIAPVRSPAPGSPSPSIATPATPVAPSERVEPRRSSPRPRLFSPAGWSAVAAGVALSFTIGATTGPWAQRSVTSLMGTPGATPVDDAKPGVAATPSSAPINFYDLTLARDSAGGGSTQMSVPVVEAPGWDEQALRSLPSAVSPEMRKQLEALGENVGEQRQLVPVVLPNGQTVLLPVDEVRVKPRHRPLQ